MRLKNQGRFPECWPKDIFEGQFILDEEQWRVRLGCDSHPEMIFEVVYRQLNGNIHLKLSYEKINFSSDDSHYYYLTDHERYNWHVPRQDDIHIFGHNE